MSQTIARTYATGVGWSATVLPESMVIHVSPEDDYLPSAVEALLSPARRRFYVIEHVAVDEDGWDVYEVINTAWIPERDDYEVAASWVTIR